MNLPLKFCLLLALTLSLGIAIHCKAENVSKQIKQPPQKIEPAKSKTNWSNAFHRKVSSSVHYSAAWFDSFFVKEGNEQLSPKTSARIGLAWLPQARDWQEVRNRFRIKVKLPHLEEKVDLIFSDDAEDDNSNLPLTVAETDIDNEKENFSAAIRYIFKERKNVITSSRIGISGRDIFARARHKRIYTWQEKHHAIIEPSIFYYLTDKAGARLLLEYDYQISDKAQFRINTSFKGSESFSGVQWHQGFYRLNQLGKNKASLFGLQMSGEHNGLNGTLVSNYSINYRYRFSALKDWLFFEVEPFLAFPKDETYKPTPGLALRIEGYFSHLK